MFGLSVWNKLLHVSVMILVSSTLLILLTATTCNATPVTLSNNNCPVPTTSTELGTTKVLDLHKIKGHKVRLQFFYPREEASRRSQESSSDELTTMVSIANVTMLDSGSSPEAGETSIEKDLYSQDIYCQWTFRAGNESQFLSLTFEKLSAPYSENCEQAYVALQKENGYESRWCGNRRQANARPMSLLAKASAVITVYRSGGAPLLPATGFKVSVRELNAGGFQGSENSLRILHA